MGEVLAKERRGEEFLHISPELIVSFQNLDLLNEAARQYPDVVIEVLARSGQYFKAKDSHGPLSYFDGMVPEKHVLIRIKANETSIAAVHIAADEIVQKKIKAEIAATGAQHRGLTF